MELKDLFVSHKQVDPVAFSKEKPSLPQHIYLNLDRAKQATSTTSDSDDMSTWRTNDTEDGEITSWRVKENTPTETSTTGAAPIASTPASTATTSSAAVTSSAGSGSGLVVPRWTSIYKGKTQQWVADMRAAYKRAGMSDNAIRNLLAKNSVESNWGASAQGAFNFGNITTGSSWKGKYVQGSDHNAKGQRIGQKFRAYDSLDDYVKDEIQFLTRLYEFDPNDSIDTFVHKLQGGNKWGRSYAEAPTYAQALKQRYKLV